MKKALCLIVCVVLMSSCYTSRVHVGTMKEVTPRVAVESKTNSFLLWGLFPLKNVQEAKTYVGDKKDYTVETQQTFIDGLLSAITLGIYGQTTTTYYKENK